jgi:hypothetical protein
MTVRSLDAVRPDAALHWKLGGHRRWLANLKARVENGAISS